MCSVWCVSKQHVPVCTFKTCPCVPAPRAHMFQHVRVVPAYTGVFWTHTRGRVEWTHGVVLSGHTWSVFIGKTSVFFHFSSILTGCWVHLIANFLLTKICPHTGYHVLQRFTKETLGSSPILRMGRGQHIPCTVQLDAQSLNAPLLPVAIHSSYEAGRTKDKDHHDNDMSTTTHHTTPHHTQPPN